MDFTNTNATKYDWCTNNNGSEFKCWTGKEIKNISQTITDEGKRKIKLVIYDEHGNKKECLNNNNIYYIDKTAPTISVDANENWTNASSVKVKISSKSDALSGVLKCQRYITVGSATGTKNQGKWIDDDDCIYSVEANGKSTVKMRVVDNAGNISKEISKSIKIDRDKPICNPTAEKSGNSTYIYPNCTDSGSGIKNIQYYVVKGSATWKDNQGKWFDGGKNYSKFTVDAEGESKLYFRAQDNAGNWSDQKDITIINKLAKTSVYNDIYCTMHNGTATASGGSTTVDCSGEITKSNCRTSYNDT